MTCVVFDVPSDVTGAAVREAFAALAAVDLLGCDLRDAAAIDERLAAARWRPRLAAAIRARAIELAWEGAAWPRGLAAAQ